MTRFARRSFDWQRIVTIAVVVIVAAGAIAWWQIRAHRHGLELSARFTSGLGVYKGSDVRILGVHVGSIDSVTPQGTTVLVKFHLDPGVKLAAGGEAVIIAPNLVADRYLQLTGAYPGSGPTQPNHSTFDTTHTATPVEIDELYQSLTNLASSLGPNGANSDGALARLLNTAAANLGGNGAQINQTITDLSQASGTLSTSRTALFATLSNLNSFTTLLANNNSSLSQVNTQLASVSTVLANDRGTFTEAMQQLASALQLVQGFIADNKDALKSNVTKLSTVATTLAKQRDSLLKTLNAAPLLLQNFLNAYDPTHNLLLSRTDLNELGVWNTGSAATAPAGGSTTTSGTTTGTPSTATTLPALLPATNQSGGSSG